jgi:uncharacterized membrane protein YphA (DoxX/SURF4 family)
MIMGNRINMKVFKHAPLLARVLLGLAFLVFGLNGFLGFIPMPALPSDGANFMTALMATGYMLPMMKIVEIVAGIALLANRFVPLALVMLTPILINILAFHAFLAPGGLVLAGGLAVLCAYLVYVNRSKYEPLWRV